MMVVENFSVLVYIIQNSPAVKKVCGPQEGHCENDLKYKVAAKKWL